MTHPALTPNRTAVITGGASGIGFAMAERLVAMGLNVCIADHKVLLLVDLARCVIIQIRDPTRLGPIRLHGRVQGSCAFL